MGIKVRYLLQEGPDIALTYPPFLPFYPYRHSVLIPFTEVEVGNFRLIYKQSYPQIQGGWYSLLCIELIK